MVTVDFGSSDVGSVLADLAGREPNASGGGQPACEPLRCRAPGIVCLAPQGGRRDTGRLRAGSCCKDGFLWGKLIQRSCGLGDATQSYRLGYSAEWEMGVE